MNGGTHSRYSQDGHDAQTLTQILREVTSTRDRVNRLEEALISQSNENSQNRRVASASWSLLTALGNWTRVLVGSETDLPFNPPTSEGALGGSERYPEERTSPKGKVASLKTENARLMSENRSQKKEMAILKEALSKKEESIRELDCIVADSVQQGTEPPDEEIAADFRSLRSQVQLVAQTYYKLRTLTRRRTFSTEQTNFFSDWENLSEAIRRFKVRAEIFGILQQEIFNKPCFGLARREEENAMMKFEQHYKKVNKMDIAEWRNRTIAVAEQLDGRPRVAAEDARNRIYELMSPLAPQQDARTAQESTLELCEQALSLALLFRKAKAAYSLESPKQGAACDGTTEAVGSETQGSAASPKVSFTVFGALLKDYRGRTQVIERSHVVIKG